MVQIECIEKSEYQKSVRFTVQDNGVINVTALQRYHGLDEFWFTIGMYGYVKNAKNAAVKAMRKQGYTFDPVELENLKIVKL